MSKDISTPDYYYLQTRLACKYDISDNHAGCYITHYHSGVCLKCRRAGECYNIHENEREER